MPLSNMLFSGRITAIYVFSKVEVLENNCIYKYIVLKQVGVTAEPSQQQQQTPKQQISWQWKYTGRLKKREKRASNSLFQEQSKRKKQRTRKTRLRYRNLNRGVGGWTDCHLCEAIFFWGNTTFNGCI